MKNNDWVYPAAFIAVVALVVAGTFAVVGWMNESHKIVPADSVIIGDRTYDVLDMLEDSGMEQTSSELEKFYSLEEVNDIVGQEPNNDYYPYGGGLNVVFDSEESGAAMMAGDSGGTSHTTTNVQVAGVDEGDIVKNDGEYAYVTASDGESVFIVRAYPASDAKIISEIRTGGTVNDLYIRNDYLVVIQQTYFFEGGYQDSAYAYSDKPTVFVKVFDVSIPEEPVMHNNATLVGVYSTSRMIDDNLYVIAGQSNYGAYEDADELPLPIDCLYYLEDENARYSLTNFMTLDIADTSKNPGVLGIYMNHAGTIYFSQDNIYITHMKPYDYTDDWSWEDHEEITVIHRIGIQGQGLKYRARGEVPGRVLNRYSMDQHNGHFRMATTVGWAWGAAEDQSRNIVTVLDMALNKTGRLDDIAPGEQIYSARFMGDRCYLVTFRQIDPFFVIDLHDAENPQILGELKIPGYSSYLHPYDENHIIGLGMESTSLKLSLFNVSDVQNPTELDNFQVAGDYSSSEALSDPHAFTFDAEKNLLAIPVYIHNYDYEGGYSRNTVQGALVLSISPENGIVEEAMIEHPAQEYEYEYYHYSPGNPVRRSFFIGQVLYTVSNTHLKANNVDGWGQAALVELG